MKKRGLKLLAIVLAISMTVITTMSVFGAESERQAESEIVSIKKNSSEKVLEDLQETSDTAVISETENDIEVGSCGENIIYELNKMTGVLMICGEGEMNTYKIDWPSPFYNNSVIQQIIIEAGITTIGDYAFYGCNNLISVTIPNTIMHIGEGAFWGCNCLTEIKIPENVTSIERHTFQNCKSLVYVDFPERLTTIQDWSFSDCINLISIGLPDGLIVIGNGAFYNCSSITKVELPNGITSIGSNVFSGCSSLRCIKLPDGIKSIGYDAFEGCSSLKSIDLPTGITNVGDYAFKSCSSLSNISIPESVCSIGEEAFCFCTGLRIITILNNTLNIGKNAFVGCGRLTDVYYSGTEDEWENMRSVIDNGYRDLTNATIHFNSVGKEDDPQSDNSFHFKSVNDGESTPPPIAVIDGVNADLQGYISIDKVIDEDELFDSITWSVSDPSILEITTKKHEASINTDSTAFDWNITVKGLKPGKVTITAVTQDGRKAVSPEITVEPLIILNDSKEAIAQLTDIPIASVVLKSADKKYLETFLPSLNIAMDETKARILETKTEVSSDGKTGKIICSLVPSSTGKMAYTVSSPCGQIADAELNLLYYNELIYRAAFLDSGNTAAKVYRDNIARETPSDLLIKSAYDNKLALSLDAWDGVTMFTEAFEDPSSVVEKVIKPKDVYSGIIMKTLEASMSFDVIDSMVEKASKDSKSILSSLDDFMKKKYKVEIADKDAFKSLPKKYQEALLEQSQKLIEKKEGYLHISNEALKGMTKAFKYVNNIEDFYQILVNYITIANMSDYMKEALRAAYQESLKTNDMYLRLAFSDCMDAVDGDLVLKCIEKESFMIGKKMGTYLFGEIWKDVTKSLPPDVQLAMAIVSLSKSATNYMFGTDDIEKAYRNLKAINTVKIIFENANKTVGQRFQKSQSVDDAGIYLSSVELLFNVMDVDCEKSYAFVDTVDNTKVSWIVKYFSGKDYSSQKNSIKGFQSTYKSTYDYNVSKAWAEQLAEGYNPFTGKYDYGYSPKMNAGSDTLKKQLNIACPVDVYVYNKSDELVASVVDGVLTCDDDNLMIGIQGEEKVVRVFNNDQYRIVYKGTDAGTMDIDIKEFDEDEDIIRTMEFYEVPLTSGTSYEMSIPSATGTAGTYKLIQQDGGAITPAYDTANAKVHKISVNNGVAIYDGMTSIEADVPAGATVNLTADIPEGYEFLRWSVSSKTFKGIDLKKPEISITMPAEDIIIKAEIKDTVSGEKSWIRLAGNGRYDTMSEIVKAGFNKTGGTVVIATGTGFRDALAAAGLSGIFDGPVILTDGKKLSTQAQEQLKRLKPSTVYIAGGKAAVSEDVSKEIKRITKVQPTRCYGQTSAGTSAALANAGKGSWSDTAIIATNKTFKDALSAAPVSYSLHMPILLADNGKSLNADVLKALKNCNIKKVIIVGGKFAVTENVETQLSKNGIAKKNISRIAGNTAVDTSAEIATYGLDHGMNINGMGIATSQNYPDALAGAALCGHNNSVLLLADEKAMKNTSFPKKHKADFANGYVFGGTFAVSDKVVKALQTAVK